MKSQGHKTEGWVRRWGQQCPERSRSKGVSVREAVRGGSLVGWAGPKARAPHQLLPHGTLLGFPHGELHAAPLKCGQGCRPRGAAGPV